jgi:hypothetical protein
MFAETKERELHVFNVAHGNNNTMIFWGDYQRFLFDYNKKHGDKVKLTLETKDHYILLHPVNKKGFSKIRVGGKLLICFSYLLIDSALLFPALFS